MKTKKSFFITTIFLLGLNTVFAKTSNEAKILELEAQIEELDKTFNVSARKFVSAYFDLSDEYFKIKNYDKAYENAIKGLRLDSYNMDIQLRAAEYEITKSEYDLAYPRLNYIIEKSDNKKIITAAQKLLEKIPQNYTAKMQDMIVQPNFEKSILLLFYPDVEEIYKTSIAQRIEQEFKITVKTKDLAYAESVDNLRDSWNDYLKETVNDLIKKNSKEALKNTLNALNMTENDLSSKEGREFFFINILLMSGYSENDVNSIRANFEDQYDANALLSQLENEILPDSNCYGVLAVTSKDIYSGEDNNNFLFGLASKNVAVMSLNRFIKFTDEKSIAMKRSVMQAFSSIGHVLGIPRCSTPLCARAYPNSLEEQDRKNDVLCPTCIKNINSVYSKK